MANIIQYYFFIFFVSAGLAAIFLVFAKKISKKYGLHDNPHNDSLKRHKEPISFLGGAGILAAFCLSLGIIWLLGRLGEFNFEGEKIAALFIAGIISWFYGFWDDTLWQDRIKINQSAKIFLQVPIMLAMSFIFYTAGIKYQIFNSSLPGIFTMAFLFLFISNAVNLQDGLDGLASGVILITMIGFSVYFAILGHVFLFLVSAAVAGAIASFLVFNWSPASIFLGNNGSYFLGFLAAFMAIMASSPSRFFYSLSPLFLLGAPILNVVYVFSKRLANGRSPFSADRGHIHDDLFKLTKSVPKSAILIFIIQFFCSALGLFFLIAFKNFL